MFKGFHPDLTLHVLLVRGHQLTDDVYELLIGDRAHREPALFLATFWGRLGGGLEEPL